LADTVDLVLHMVATTLQLGKLKGGDCQSTMSAVRALR
jgi:hypothetical protein